MKRLALLVHSTRQLVKQSASQNLSELVAPERPDRKGPAPLVAIGPFGGCAVIAAGLRSLPPGWTSARLPSKLTRLHRKHTRVVKPVS